tara:strand:+ start:255 stop:575 length:321 start_codon:yes stop_codon:yes gene_type:complete
MTAINLPLASDLPFGNIRTRFFGVATIETDGVSSVDGVETNIFHAGEGSVNFVSFQGSTTATIEHGQDLDDLPLDRLQALVSFLDVDTAAQTASGLRRAIERHLEG